jgi:hypothetical protein
VLWFLKSKPTLLPFELAKANFYNAAQKGLDAQLHWLDSKRYNVSELLIERLLPQAAEGLQSVGIGHDESTTYLEILRKRITSGQTGAVWQRNFANRCSFDMEKLTRCYLAQQETHLPVHQWEQELC